MSRYDDRDPTDVGIEFQARAAASGNVQSPNVARRDDGAIRLECQEAGCSMQRMDIFAERANSKLWIVRAAVSRIHSQTVARQNRPRKVVTVATNFCTPKSVSLTLM